MLRRTMLLIGLIAVLLSSGTALAQDQSTGPDQSDPTWHATYWANTQMVGRPALDREEDEIDYNWGYSSPNWKVPVDGFSARWTRTVDFEAGTYRFTSTSDDGMRVWVDNSLIIKEWTDHAAKTVAATKALSAGRHLITVEYYENGGVAVAQLSWSTSASIKAWRGEYYNNTTLSGTPALVRDDAAIDFEWGEGSPAPGVVGANVFSVRWTRSLKLAAGSYRFSMTTDDGGRLWVNGHLLIDAWKDQIPTTYTGTIYVRGGNVPVKMEYYENWSNAVAHLSWTRLTDPDPAIVVVDDQSPGFVKGGSATGWHVAYEGYQGRLLWTKNNDYARPNYNWVRWYPSLRARSYEVLVYIPDRYSTTSQARYWVSHADGSTLRVVNQSANGGQWVSLGVYRFRGNDSDYVSLADVTYESYLSRLIAFDAVKWVPR